MSVVTRRRVAARAIRLDRALEALPLFRLSDSADEGVIAYTDPQGGRWRGIAHVPNGNLRLRDEFAAWDARRRFTIDMAPLWDHAPAALVAQCQCGDIMAGIASPHDCALFGRECTPDAPVGACMVSSEGTCKIWHQYGGHPDLRQIRRRA